MDHSRNIQLGLMHYFGSVGSTAGRTFAIRDFNAQVMMNAFAAQERDGLQPALEALIAAGILSRISATEYCLTAEGTRLVREKNRAVNPWCDVAREDAPWT